MSVAETFRRALEGGAFEPLARLYAPETVIDAVVVGRRVRLTRGEHVPGLFAEWWSTPGRLTRWDVREFESGLTLDFERLANGELARQRHFVQLEGDRIVRHQLYACQPLGSPRLEPTEAERELAARATAGLGEIVHQEPLTHAGQTGSRLERVILADGTRLVLKHLRTDDWVARATLDHGREFALPARSPTRARFAGDARRAGGRAELHRKDLLRRLGGVRGARAGGRRRRRLRRTRRSEAARSPLLDCGKTLAHTDLRGANMGFSGNRVIILDWGLATLAPSAFDFAWHLFVNGWRIEATREELIDDFRAAEAELVDDRQLELGLLAGIVWHGGLLSHELIESDAAKRERARDELDWWTRRVRRGLERL